MTSNLTSNLNNDDLSDIRDAVPALDLLAIRSLRRAGFQIVRQSNVAEIKDDHVQPRSSDWDTSRRSTNSAA